VPTQFRLLLETIYSDHTSHRSDTVTAAGDDQVQNRIRDEWGAIGYAFVSPASSNLTP